MDSSFTPIEQMLKFRASRHEDFPYQEILLTRLCMHMQSKLLENRNKMLKAQGINETLFMALITLESQENHSIQPSELSCALGSSRTNATRIADELEKQACEKNIKVIFEVKPTNFSLVMLDPVRWKQIIINIMKNSIQYGKNGGYTRCEIDAELMKPGWEMVTMRFTDNGPGMEEEFQRTVFQDFVCYDEENRGSGLGLPLVQHIVTNMGGKMQLSSRLGEGTAVTVRIPVRSADVSDYENAKRMEHMIRHLDKTDFSKIRALVVDDSWINRELMCALLVRIGVQVETAEDGQQAIGRLLASDIGYYQVVFMDIQMPVKDGLEATMEIRKMERQDLSDITIIAVTAHAFRKDRLRTLEAGVDYHLTLPLNQMELTEILARELLENDLQKESEVRGFRIVK